MDARKEHFLFAVFFGEIVAVKRLAPLTSLKIGNGDFVSIENLQEYGRTDVAFTKIDEEQYYMDFSKPVK